MFKWFKTLSDIYKATHPHFLYVDYEFYKKWKWIIILLVILNKRYSSCEIFRKRWKSHRNFVVIGLKWSGKNVKRRTNGFAKDFLLTHKNAKCPYCGNKLTEGNATSDHIVPISKKGNNCQVNLVVTCGDCNKERGTIPFPDYIRMKNPRFKNIKDIFL